MDETSRSQMFGQDLYSLAPDRNCLVHKSKKVIKILKNIPCQWSFIKAVLMKDFGLNIHLLMDLRLTITFPFHNTTKTKKLHCMKLGIMDGKPSIKGLLGNWDEMQWTEVNFFFFFLNKREKRHYFWKASK